MNATPAQQRRLLEIADLDVRRARAEHERTHPPQAARVRELSARRTELTRELTDRQGTRDDLRTELRRVESDVEVVENRRRRDEERLAQAANAKDAQGLESELASLARRTGELEDAQLELMERLDDAERAVTEKQAALDAVNEEGARLSAEGKAAVAAAADLLEQITRDRAAVAGEVPGDLLALYEKSAARGTGAALLRRQTCEGCRMMLSGTDLNTVRQAAPDEVVTCPECGCILVRTEESGV